MKQRNKDLPKNSMTCHRVGCLFVMFFILQVVRPVVEYVDKEGSCVGAMDP